MVGKIFRVPKWSQMTLICFPCWPDRERASLESSFRLDPILCVTPSAASYKGDLNETKGLVQAVVTKAYIYAGGKKTINNKALQWFCLGPV